MPSFDCADHSTGLDASVTTGRRRCGADFASDALTPRRGDTKFATPGAKDEEKQLLASIHCQGPPFQSPVSSREEARDMTEGVDIERQYNVSVAIPTICSIESERSPADFMHIKTLDRARTIVESILSK